MGAPASNRWQRSCSSTGAWPGGAALADEASARLRPLADDVKAVLSVTRPVASAEASMGFLAELVDR